MINEIIKRLEAEREENPCRYIKCNECSYTKICYEGEQSGKVAIDNAIQIVQEVAKEYGNGWIPVTYHVATDEEREEMCLSDDIAYILDCPMPDEEQEIIVCSERHVWTDTCMIDDGYSLDSGNDWCGDIVAWMPMPKKYEPKKQKGE